jgi:hypothetical protein
MQRGCGPAQSRWLLDFWRKMCYIWRKFRNVIRNMTSRFQTLKKLEKNPVWFGKKSGMIWRKIRSGLQMPRQFYRLPGGSTPLISDIHIFCEPYVRTIEQSRNVQRTDHRIVENCMVGIRTIEQLRTVQYTRPNFGGKSGMICIKIRYEMRVGVKSGIFGEKSGIFGGKSGINTGCICWEYVF